MANYNIPITDMAEVWDIASAAGKWLEERGETIACAESCTGGLLTSCLTDNPGSSAYVKGAIVSYADEVKEKLVGVPHEMLAAHGAVSAEVARAMAEGVRARLGASMGIGITGIAGPEGGTAEKPVGLVYIAVAGEHGMAVRENHFNGGRMEIKEHSVAMALRMLLDYNLA